MLILSQDKDKILNFNNIIQVYVNKYANEYPDISCDTLNELNINLGDYKTEERAKEVLQEIIKKYNEYGEIASPKIGIINIVTLPKVYKMPEK